MAGKISQLLDPSRINLHVRSTKRVAALSEVAQTLVNHPEMVNFDGFYAELLARDRLDTTCLGNEIALPHARTEHVRAVVLAIGRSESGVLFENSNDNVRLMFMLGTPKTKPGDYLLIVSSLCKLLKDPAHRDSFMNAATPEDFIRAVVAAEERALTPA